MHIISALSQVPSALKQNDILHQKRVYMAGACILNPWIAELASFRPDIDAEHFVTAGMLPELPTHPIEDYAFMLAAIPRAEVSLEFLSRVPYSDINGHQKLLDRCVDRMQIAFEAITAWSDKMPVLLMNFLTPQYNHNGRLLHRYDIRNPVYFTSKLNEKLYEFASMKPNVYIMDIDLLSSSYGKQRIQDDGLWALTHGSLLDAYDWGPDQERLEISQNPLQYFPTEQSGFIRLCWEEAFSIYRTLRNVDTVKMVCVDLDDTLWRGVMAEREFIDRTFIAGWPLGFAEALLSLKKRGIILCIISKNDEERVRGFWRDLYGMGEIRIEDFAIVKINWDPKAGNIKAAIAEANILPSSVVFIDDNPVERASVIEAIPGIRVLGAPHYLWRDTLMRSSETQVSLITDESASRSEMIKAQIEREEVRKAVSREEFLAGLDLRVVMRRMSSSDNSRFPRALELINKTNQFNTTGVRWTLEEAETHFRNNGCWWTFEVTDKFTNYGLVGVIIAQPREIKQYVMSCRVLGMEVERGALASVVKDLVQSSPEIRSTIVATAANMPCRDLFRNSGWHSEGDTWLSGGSDEVPSHIAIEVAV